MPIAIFNITNDTLSTAVSLAIFVLVVIWLATIVYTFLDARRRIEDPFLVGCATIAAFFPFIGTAVYAILRPPELISDARERELDIRTAELRLRHLTEQSCPNCNFPIDKNFLRCPACERHLKDACETCSRPVDPRWALCPYCETALPGRQRRSRAPARPQRSDSDGPEGKRSEAGRKSTGKPQQRSKTGSKSSSTSSKKDAQGASGPQSKQGSGRKAPAKRDR